MPRREVCISQRDVALDHVETRVAEDPLESEDITQEQAVATDRTPRPAVASAGYIDRARAHGDARRQLPSRSPEARHAEYQRAKRRENGQDVQ